MLSAYVMVCYFRLIVGNVHIDPSMCILYIYITVCCSTFGVLDTFLHALHIDVLVCDFAPYGFQLLLVQVASHQ